MIFNIQTNYENKVICETNIICDTFPTKDDPQIVKIVEATRGILDQCKLSSSKQINVHITQANSIDFSYPRLGNSFFKDYLTDEIVYTTYSTLA